MTEFLDDLARSLAKPMPRRRAIRVVGAVLVGASAQSTGSLARAALGRSQHVCDTNVAKEGWKYCTPASERCFPTCCPQAWACCKGDCGSNGCCEMFCCNPCNPQQSRCLGGGRCGPGPVRADCCGGELGRTRCGSGCCNPGEFCANAAQRLCCKTGERGCGNQCCAPNEECRRIRIGTSSVTTCERRCPPQRAWCGRNKCCPPRWRCANERTGLCKRCQLNEEECGTKCCDRRTSRCCGEAGCCPDSRSCCVNGTGPGGSQVCCPPRTKCATPILPGNIGIVSRTPAICCPLERFNNQPKLCCPPGMVALNVPGLRIPPPGVPPDCCPRGQVCGSGTGRFCANLQSEQANCGRCGNVCQSGTICKEGVCAPP